MIHLIINWFNKVFRSVFSREESKPSMFQNIFSNSISIVIERPERGTFSIPSGDAIMSAEKLWRMLEWIHEEFLEDCRINQRSNWVRNEKFNERNTSRTISYTIHVCLLEGILRRMYIDMIMSLSHRVNGGITSNQNELGIRREEVQDIYDFRNMVAAHTVYADPRYQDDDIAGELTSLSVLTASGINGDDLTTFAIGVMQVLANGDHPARTIPRMNIKDLHSRMIAHFEEWVNMFVQKLQEADRHLPIQNTDFTARAR
ncbi:MAG: hypothetical protein WDZ80_03820 [Candidatus Paceibacterota bacterium]